MKLIDISKDNWQEVIMLTTNTEGIHYLGEEYVASNAYSIVEATYENGWTVKAIEDEDKIIGFAMYGLSEEENYYEIIRFMIDRKYQGKGYGKKSLSIIIDEMKKSFPCNEIYLSVDSENVRAKHIYENAGFRPTGEVEDEEGEEMYKLSF